MKAIYFCISFAIIGSSLLGDPSEDIFIPSQKGSYFLGGTGHLIPLVQLHRRTNREKLVRIIRHKNAIEVRTGNARAFEDEDYAVENPGICVSVGCVRYDGNDGMRRFLTTIEEICLPPDHPQFKPVDQAVAKIIEEIAKRAPYDAREEKDYVNHEDAKLGLMLMESYQEGVGYKYIVIPKVDTELDLLWRKFLRSKGKKPGQEETSGPLKEKT
jgi:hypothetical protein